ncbi:MAG: hypothetical protein Q7T61_01140 [Caulobacter sp.]|nr:hypothetical protein [Caulobacter sp.]
MIPSNEDLSKVPLSEVAFGDVAGLAICFAVVAGVGMIIGLSMWAVS